jgi:hypothetical protein
MLHSFSSTHEGVVKAEFVKQIKKTRRSKNHVTRPVQQEDIWGVFTVEQNWGIGCSKKLQIRIFSEKETNCRRGLFDSMVSNNNKQWTGRSGRNN